MTPAFRAASKFHGTNVLEGVYLDDCLYGGESGCMRITIEIDDALLSSAMAATDLRTKKAVVEEGLRLLVRIKGSAAPIRDTRNSVPLLANKSSVPVTPELVNRLRDELP